MASFEIDRQTLDDLGIFKAVGNGEPVRSFFDHLQTIGGQKKLTQMMETPSADIGVLNSRRDCIKYFYDNPLSFDIDRRDLDFIEHYLSFGAKVLNSNYIDATLKGLNYKFQPDNNYYVITHGINDIFKLLRSTWAVYKELSGRERPKHIQVLLGTLEAFFSTRAIEKFIDSAGDKAPNYLQVAYYDQLFRKAERAGLKSVLEVVYELDLYLALAKAAEINNFCFPEYCADSTHVDISGLYHPGIKNAVGNSIVIDRNRNVVFLTGANMAGKSSFLKALALSVYLAHIGFPVPALGMKTAVFDGLITTINLSDNIGSGYSHYYSEIKRLKETAQKILERDNLFIIFDELFRGTNVKDAYDASLATIGGLSAIKNSVFLISTHIVEVAAELTHLPNISYQYFAARMDNGRPVFEYKLMEGISSETLGFFIFQNEGILEILEKAAQNPLSGEPSV